MGWMLSSLRGSQNPLAHQGPVGGRQAWNRTMATERNGLTQGGDEDFTVGTGAQVPADFAANISRKFIIDVGGQLSENVQALALPMVMSMPRRRSAQSLVGSLALCHGTVPSAIQARRVRDRASSDRALGR